MTENKKFEDNLAELEKIVANLERGNVPLEDALAQFEVGVKLSQELQKTLTDAEKTLTKMINNQGQEVAFDVENSK